MLTDYHLHLRPDEPGTEAERYFTEENVGRYLEAAEAAGVAELGVSEHAYRFRDALAIWRHPFWEEQARDDLSAYCEFVRSTPLRLGIEMDFVPGAEDRIATLLDAYDFDYVVGSVHFVGDTAVDHEGFDAWEATGDAERVWGRYFEMLAEAARSGLFDILAHPDLVKIWGKGRPLPAPRPALLLRAGRRGDRGIRHRRRGLDRRASQAGRRDLSVARAGSDVRGRRGAVRALL